MRIAEFQKLYVANCKNCFKDDWFVDHIANDATELAQVADHFEDNEDIQKIDFDTFAILCEIPDNILQKIHKRPDNYEYYNNTNVNLAWIYDVKADVHHFFCE